jgi:hypothetical protein
MEDIEMKNESDEDAHSDEIEITLKPMNIT